MNDLEIKKFRNLSRTEAHSLQSPLIWEKFKETKYAVKRVVRKANSTFYRKSLAKNNPKEIWKIIHGILHPPAKCITFNPAVLNKYFATIACDILKKKAIQKKIKLTNSLTIYQKLGKMMFLIASTYVLPATRMS